MYFFMGKKVMLFILGWSQISVKQEFAFFPQFLYDLAYRICG